MVVRRGTIRLSTAMAVLLLLTGDVRAELITVAVDGSYAIDASNSFLNAAILDLESVLHAPTVSLSQSGMQPKSRSSDDFARRGTLAQRLARRLKHNIAERWSCEGPSEQSTESTTSGTAPSAQPLIGSVPVALPLPQLVMLLQAGDKCFVPPPPPLGLFRPPRVA